MCHHKALNRAKLSWAEDVKACVSFTEDVSFFEPLNHIPPDVRSVCTHLIKDRVHRAANRLAEHFEVKTEKMREEIVRNVSAAAAETMAAAEKEERSDHEGGIGTSSSGVVRGLRDEVSLLEGKLVGLREERDNLAEKLEDAAAEVERAKELEKKRKIEDKEREETEGRQLEQVGRGREGTNGSHRRGCWEVCRGGGGSLVWS